MNAVISKTRITVVELFYNAGVYMTRPAFSVVVPQCGLALSGELYMGVAA